jgi:hypothetical protein
MREGRSRRVRVYALLAAGALAMFALTASSATAVTPPQAPSALVSFSPGPGTGPPPGFLGGFFMTPFPLDAQGSPVTSVPSPLGCDVLFGTPTRPQSLGHVTVGAGWATWSHGYTGDVYTNFTAGGPGSFNDVDYTTYLTMPPGTKAFYLYAEPNSFGLHRINATAVGSDGSFASSGYVQVEGFGGARFYGFYANAFTTITRIVVTAKSDANGFAIGEFGIAGGCD